MKAVKRPCFLLDIAEELTWLNDHAGAEVAERWYEALMGTIDFVCENPGIGRPRNDLTPEGIRSWRMSEFPRWQVFYRSTNEGDVIFYRVRSGTMNLVVMKMES